MTLTTVVSSRSWETFEFAITFADSNISFEFCFSECFSFTTWNPSLLHELTKTSLKSLIFDEIFTVTNRFTEEKTHSLFFFIKPGS